MFRLIVFVAATPSGYWEGLNDSVTSRVARPPRRLPNPTDMPGMVGDTRHTSSRPPLRRVALGVLALAHVELDHGKGRIVRRAVWVAPATGVEFPGAAQVVLIRRDTFDHQGNRLSKEIVHSVTSLTAQQATPR